MDTITTTLKEGSQVVKRPKCCKSKNYSQLDLSESLPSCSDVLPSAWENKSRDGRARERGDTCKGDLLEDGLFYETILPFLFCCNYSLP